MALSEEVTIFSGHISSKFSKVKRRVKSELRKIWEGVKFPEVNEEKTPTVRDAQPNATICTPVLVI